MKSSQVGGKTSIKNLIVLYMEERAMREPKERKSHERIHVNTTTNRWRVRIDKKFVETKFTTPSPLYWFSASPLIAYIYVIISSLSNDFDIKQIGCIHITYFSAQF